LSAKIECLKEFKLGFPTQALRAAVFDNAGTGNLMFAHADTPDQQPGMPDIQWPKDNLHISAFTMDGEQLWTHDVGKGVMPGLWFCPVFAFDLDGDGVDEIYHVGNASGDFPFNKDRMELTALCGRTGKVLRRESWPWFSGDQTMSDTFRYFISGGYSNGRPRLITAQGTYHELSIHAWDENMKLLWERAIHADEPGCRASHMFPVLDIDGDGKDEIFFGERCIDIDTGQDKWIADKDSYHGHSDIMMPTLNRETGRWSIFTCREFPWPEGSRGVVMFDDKGTELWGHRGMDHMHNGWTARLNDDGSHLCYAVEMFKVKQGGEKKISAKCHLYDLEGKSTQLPFDLAGATPVDINGDGLHELVYRDEHPYRGKLTLGEKIGLVLDRYGNKLGHLQGNPGNLPRSKLLDCPGEQIMTFDSGTIRIYGCPGAVDSVEAKARYAHPYYNACQRMTAVGYNWRNLGGV
jgi:hypothetical protein